MTRIKRAKLLLFLLLTVSAIFILSRDKWIDKAKADVITGSLSVNPCNDTIISMLDPNTQIWYSNNKVKVGYSPVGSEDYRMFLKFNLSEAYIGAINVTNVYLYVYAVDIYLGTPPATYRLRTIDPTNETWNEKTITWNNAPTRKNWLEAPDESVNGSYRWNTWILVAGNSTTGVGGIQTAYNARTTRTFVLNCLTTPYVSYFMATNNPNYKPKLLIYYNQTLSSEPIMTAPTIDNPEEHDLTFYGIEDAKISSALPNTNFGSEDYSQISYSTASGTTADLLVKFNLTFPSLVDGVPPSTPLNLATEPFDIKSITFDHYCIDSSARLVGYVGFEYVRGIYRANETWEELMVNWTKKPTYRNNALSPAHNILTYGYFGFDLIRDEDYIRYSVTYGYTYTVVHAFDQTKVGGQAFSSWLNRENATYLPRIQMKVVLESQAVSVSPSLTWDNMHIFFARAIGVDYLGELGNFIAGLFLCALVYVTLIVPIGFALHDNDHQGTWLLIVTFALLTSFVFFKWLNIYFFGLLTLLTLILKADLIGKLAEEVREA